MNRISEEEFMENVSFSSDKEKGLFTIWFGDEIVQTLNFQENIGLLEDLDYLKMLSRSVALDSAFGDKYIEEEE